MTPSNARIHSDLAATSNLATPPTGKKGGFAPAITLMIAAPLLTEILPGATRFSSIFVLPIEMCVWGGGALLIRFLVKKYRLGWLSMWLLGLALAIAEECLIQQTSLAPMVIHLKDAIYAREYGVNYVYFLWALIYEPVFVVVLPVYLVELIFPDRREGSWLTKSGLFLIIPLFLLGSLLAWFSWTRIARPKVFHVPPYNPPPATVILALVAIVALVWLALGPGRKSLVQSSAPISSLHRPTALILSGLAGAIWAILLFGLVLLGFGIDPQFPPLIAVTGGLVLLILALRFIPRATANTLAECRYQFSLIFGVMLGSMIAGQLGFSGTTGPDLYFKIISNIIAIALMIILGSKLKRQLV
jgi:hypothetical protein